MNIRLSLWIPSLLLGALSLSANSAFAGPDDNGTDVYKLEVMTQNLYVGADVFRIFEGAPCGPLQSVYQIFATMEAAGFPERAEAIADVVMRAKPHVIGLQEVSLIRKQVPADGAIIVEGEAPDFTFRFLPNAELVVYDYLDLLMGALAARGLDYVVVEDATSWNADIEFPMANFDEFCGLTSIPTDLRLTDRDVILVRGDLATANAMNGNFAANLPVAIDVGGPFPLAFEFVRGFGALDVTVGKYTHRVVNTHLEVGNADDISSPLNTIQFFQALEFISSVTGTALPLTVIGDFNSSPSLFDVRPAYGMMAGAGYLDLWTMRQGAFDPGFTCCQDEELRNAMSVLDRRIDFVWSRLPEGSDLMPIRSDVVGYRDNEKSVSGMWPSDHAGVVTTLKFKQE
jgi:endonuclease/exonuclease/phosphatase family metal-dependent hydrolase